MDLHISDLFIKVFIPLTCCYLLERNSRLNIQRTLLSSSLLLVLSQGTWAAAPVNDSLVAAIDFSGKIPYTTQQSTVSATTEAGELMSKCSSNNTASVWYKFTPSADQNIMLDTMGSDYDSTLSIWTGTAHPLNEVACNDDSQGKQSQLAYTFKAGTSYYIGITGYTGETGKLILNAKPIEALTNDNLANAIAVSSANYSNIQVTTGASIEPTEMIADCALSTLGNSVWYKYTPATNQTAVFSTFGSDYNTLLSIWTGTQHPLTQVACNDDTNGMQSQIVTPLTAGTSYFINVAGVASSGGTAESGNLIFKVSTPPVNDALANATTVNSLSYVDNISTAGASNETGELSPSCAVGSNSVWYKYTATTSQNVSFATLKSDYDTVISVWTGAAHPLKEIACNDDAITSDDQEKASQVAVPVTAGTTYYIGVTGNYGGAGKLAFRAEAVVNSIKITQQPTAATVNYNQPATLAVSISSTDGKAVAFQWYEGNAGDISIPVGANSNYFTSPNLTRNTRYWVRITNASGSVDSEAVLVSVKAPNNAKGVDLNGNAVSTSASFGLEVTTPKASGNNVKADQADNISVDASITADAAHVGKTADILMVGIYNNIAFMRDGDNWTPWDGSIASIAVAKKAVALSNSALPVNIFKGSFKGLPGSFQVYVGYRVDNQVIFNGNEPISFLVQ